MKPEEEIDERPYLDHAIPSISIYETLGGFFRVVIHGPDNLQSQSDRPRFCEMDIGRGDTKEEALLRASHWFNDIEDRTPRSKP